MPDPQVPAGWTVTRREGAVEITAPGGDGVLVRLNATDPYQRILARLSLELLDHTNYKLALFDQQEQTKALVRELDVALNGEAGAAPQAKLVDVVAQVKTQAASEGKPVLEQVPKPTPAPTPKPTPAPTPKPTQAPAPKP